MAVKGTTSDIPEQYQINQLQSTSNEFQMMYGRYHNVENRYRPYQRPVQQSTQFQPHHSDRQPTQRMYSASPVRFPMTPSLRSVSIHQTPLRGVISNGPYAPSKHIDSFAISNQTFRPDLTRTDCSSTIMQPVGMEIARHSQPPLIIPTNTPQRRPFAPIQQQSLRYGQNYNSSIALQQSTYGNTTSLQPMPHGNQFKSSQATGFQGDKTHRVTDQLQQRGSTFCEFSSNVQLPVNGFDNNVKSRVAGDMPKNSMVHCAYQTIPLERHARYPVSNPNPINEAPNTSRMLQTPLRTQNVATVVGQTQPQMSQTTAVPQIPDNQCKLGQNLGNFQHGMHQEQRGIILQSPASIINPNLQSSTSTPLYHLSIRQQIPQINHPLSTESQCSESFNAMKQSSSKSHINQFITNANIVVQKNQQVIVPAISTVQRLPDTFPSSDTSVRSCHPALIQEVKFRHAIYFCSMHVCPGCLTF